MFIFNVKFGKSDFKHKDTKKRRFYLDTKTTSDLKVATKACSVKTLWTL